MDKIHLKQLNEVKAKAYHTGQQYVDNELNKLLNSIAVGNYNTYSLGCGNRGNSYFDFLYSETPERVILTIKSKDEQGAEYTFLNFEISEDEKSIGLVDLCSTLSSKKEDKFNKKMGYLEEGLEIESAHLNNILNDFVNAKQDIVFN